MSTSKKPIERSSKGIAEAMFREMDALCDGTSTPQKARAMSALANSAIGAARLEMDFSRFVAAERTQLGSAAQLSTLQMGETCSDERPVV